MTAARGVGAPRRVGRVVSLVPALVAVLLTAAVGSAGAAADPVGTGMRGDRYCELLLLRPAEGHLDAQVWNTYGLNDCPEADWAALDTGAVARDAGVAAALRNGPRYWLVDKAVRSVPPASAVESLGGIPMRQLGAVSLQPSDITAGAYRAQRVVRNTTLVWPAGKRVYELTAPDGAVYVMQSWSAQVDPALDERALAGLAGRLALPDGWTFSTRVPRRPIRVGTDAAGAATVLQDELMNAYSRRA